MRRHRSVVALGAALGMMLGMSVAVPTIAGAVPQNPIISLTSSDNGDGTYDVPLFNADVPDVSVEFVPASENDEGRDIYYMISTTMHLSPGAPIMKSYDLVNWETVNYVYNRLDIVDQASLRNGQSSYGQGQWASSLRYHEGKYYLAVNSLNLGGTYIFITDDPDNGEWEKIKLNQGFHDLSLFFDVDGTPYLIHGGKNLSITKLSPDLRTVVADYPDVIRTADFLPTQGLSLDGLGPEGAQVYFIDGNYYVVTITWPPNQGRQVVAFKSPNLLGRYTNSPNGTAPNTYQAKGILNSDGFAQGSLVPVRQADGSLDWQGFFFRDTYPLGRIPALIPATWQNGWPVFGNNGVVNYGDTFTKPITLTPQQQEREQLRSVVASDDFTNDAAKLPYVEETHELPEPLNIDPSLIGVQLVTNGDFQTGTLAPFTASGGGTITVVDDAGSKVAKVTNRPAPGSGPWQSLAGKIQAGVEYQVSMRVRYDTGPATKQFLLTVQLGDGYVNLGGVTATKGQWTTLNARYMVAADRNVSTANLFVETPWTPNPDPVNDLMDFSVDDISVVGIPSEIEYPNAGEIAYNGSNLDLAWEWNHNPDNRYWSLTDRDGWLRLTNGKVVTGKGVYSKFAERDQLTWFEEARNTLSQRTFGPKGSAETKLDITGMKDGDTAGLAVYTRAFTYAAVQKRNGVNTLGIVNRTQPFDRQLNHAQVESFVPGTTVNLGAATQVWLKADTDFRLNQGQLLVTYRYSTDGVTWHQLGAGPQGPFTYDWSLSHFMGFRFGLFSYATQQTGGHVDFDYYYLSDKLTADQPTPDRAKLDAQIARAESLSAAGYTPATWAELTRTLAIAKSVTAATTQNQIDAPTYDLAVALADLEQVDTPTLAFTTEAGVRALAGKNYLAVRVVNDNTVPVDVKITTPYGEKVYTAVQPNKAVSVQLATRLTTVPAGETTIAVTGLVGSNTVTTTKTVPYTGR